MLHLENPINIMTGGYFEGDDSWGNARRSSDDCYKIYYITSGSIWVESTQGEKFYLLGGKIYLINGYKISSYGCTESFDTHWIHFVPQNLDTNRALFSLPAVIEIPNLLLQQAIRNDIYLDKNKIYDGDDMHSMQQQLKLHHHIQGVIIEVLHDYNWSEYSKCKDHDRLSPALSYIKDNFCRNILLEEIAKLCNMSPNHFHKIFSAALHLTPCNYITQLRMNRALTLISKRLSIKEISYELGYCNDAHFSRVFKRYYGFPPGLFRSSELVKNELARLISDNLQL